MPKTEWKQKHLKAFKKYLKGESMQEIARDLDINPATMYRWEKRDNWKGLLDKQNKELQNQLNIDIFEEKERSIKLIKAGEAYWARKLQEGDLKTNFSDLALLQRIKWDLLTPRSINQFNYLKQENNINEIKFKIIDPNGNNMETKPETIDSMEYITGQENN